MKTNCIICGDISSENKIQNCPISGTCFSCGLCSEEKESFKVDRCVIIKSIGKKKQDLLNEYRKQFVEGTYFITKDKKE